MRIVNFLCGVLLFLTLTSLTGVAVEPITASLSESEVSRMRLISEAYMKMQRHYYVSIPPTQFETLFYNVEIMAARLLKEKTRVFDDALDTLIYGTLEYMVYTLRDSSDTVSRFIHKSLLKQVVRENFKSAFSGIGIEIERTDDVYTIRRVYANSSAEEQGVQLGDTLIAIAGESVREKSFEAVEALLRIPHGARIMISIMRAVDNVVVDVELLCTIISVPSISYWYEETEKIGYVKIGEFRDETAREVEGQIEQLAEQGMRGLILDLRGNDGGNMEQGVAVCDFFLPPEVLVCYFLKRDVGRKDQKTQQAVLSAVAHMPVVILVDGQTGSAAEIVAGTLRHYQKAVLVGQKTKGTGALKNTVGLSDGSVLYLMTSRTYLPDDSTFNDVGIQPDVEEEDRDTQYQRAIEIIRSHA